MENDGALLKLYLDHRSEKAFAELMKRHLRAVYSVVLRRVGGDVHLAEEATQDVFAALSSKAPSLVTMPSLAGWLFVSARFASAKIVRRERRKRALSLDEDSSNIDKLNREAEPDWSALRPAIDGLIERLSTPDREALLLRFYEGLSFVEMGEALNLSENTARMRVSRALDKLRVRLLRSGVTSTGLALATALANQAIATVPVDLSADLCVAALSHTPAASATFSAFMTISKTQTTILAALLVGTATFVGVRQHMEIASLAARLNEKDIALSKMETQLRQLAMKAAPSVVESNIPSTGKKNPPSPQPSKKDNVQVVHVQEVIRDHPEFASLYRLQLRESILAQYIDTIRMLHLTQSQQKKLKDLLVERQIAATEAATLAREAGADDDSPEMLKARADARSLVDHEIQSVIGVAAADRLEKLGGSSNFGWNSPGIISLHLEDDDKPLTLEQTTQLQEAFYQSSKAAPTGGSRLQDVDPKTWLSNVDQDFLRRASTFLRPEQIDTATAALSYRNHYQQILGKYNNGRATMVLLQ